MGLPQKTKTTVDLHLSGPAIRALALHEAVKTTGGYISTGPLEGEDGNGDWLLTEIVRRTLFFEKLLLQGGEKEGDDSKDS